MKAERVSTFQAAEELQIGVESVRYLMEQERLPIGIVIRKPKSKKATYIIYRGLLDQELARIAGGGQRKW